jgi:chromosomal replication initiator protein
LAPNQALIEVPNKFVASWITDNYLHHIQDAFKTNLKILPDIKFTYNQSWNHPRNSENKPRRESQIRLSHQLNPSYLFENFVTAKSNRFAYSSALEVAQNPSPEYNPLYIFSDASCGKTHLLNAIGNHVLTNRPSTKIRYESTDQFCSDFSLAAKKQNLHKFRETHKNLDLLLVDDTHLFAGREYSQIEFVALFNALSGFNRQIVIASTGSPSQIPDLNPQLRSRMESGLLSQIQNPDQKTRMKIIRKKAEEVNLVIPEDVTFFLTNATSDLKTIIQYLVRLETFASLYQREVNMSTVKLIVKDSYLSKKSLRDIQKLTAQCFNISLSDLLSNKKKREFSYPRQLAMYLSRKFTTFSFKKIGKSFGNKDHSTVIHAVKRIEKEKELRKEVLTDIQRIERFLS